MDSVARGALINFATRVLGVALVLVVTAVTARLGTAAQGTFALFTSAEGLLLALCSGFGILLARRVSHERSWPHALVAATIVGCVVLGGAAALVLAAVARWAPPAYAPLWLLACAAPLVLLAPNLSGLWLGASRMAPMAALSLAAPALALAAIGAVAVFAAVSLHAVLVAWVAAKAAVGIGAVVAARRGAPRAAPDFAALKRETPFVATIGLTNLVGLLNYRVGLFVVERHLGIEPTGVYSIAVVVAELLWFVSGSLTQAAYGRIGTPDAARAAATTLRVVHLSLAALLVAAPLLWLAARGVVPAVLGPAYAPSLPALALLLPGVLLFGGASAFSAYFTNHAGAPQVPARVAALSLVVNAATAFVLVPRFGMPGAAVAASFAYAASVLMLAWLFARHAGLPLGRVVLPGRQLRDDLRAVALRARGP